MKKIRNYSHTVPEVGPHLTGSEAALDQDGRVVLLLPVLLGLSEGDAMIIQTQL